MRRFVAFRQGLFDAKMHTEGEGEENVGHCQIGVEKGEKRTGGLPLSPSLCKQIMHSLEFAAAVWE